MRGKGIFVSILVFDIFEKRRKKNYVQFKLISFSK